MKTRSSVCLFALVLIAAAARPVLGAPQHGFFQSKGVKIHYVMAGTGEPVVLVHGFAASAYANWLLPGIFDELSKHFHVVALDNRGHGGSEKPHEVDKYGTEMVEDVVRLMDHLKIEKAHVVGYSMGAFITNKLLTTHPERVLTATLGGAGWGREDDDRTVLEALARSLEEGKGIIPLMRALQPPGGAVPTDDELKGRSDLVMSLNDQKALAACARGMVKLAVPRAPLEQNTIPVLAIIGEKDPLKKGVDAMDGVMKNLKVVVVAGGDHLSTFRSSEFQRTLGEFLEAHPAKALAKAGAK
jgi:pimeloyl-ACP methyl ester carboxylesterase